MAATLMNGAMDLLHEQSLPTIGLLQESFPDNKNFMINISTLFDPRYVFLIYAPILFALNKRVGHRMIIALTLTEWTNQILKWLLAGERPYWYAQERASEQHNFTASGIDSYDTAAINLQQPIQLQLKQFSVTCELGAGSPSGHAMVTATVWYVLIDSYLKGELPLFGRASNGSNSQLVSHNKLTDKLAKVSWSIYTLILLLVSLSRVYLACHFPHQCLCGAILGVVVARLVSERLPLEQLKRRHFCMATIGMLSTAMGTYLLLRSLGVNPLWSVDKGMRWCAKKEYIHLDTTPFFSMTRYLGFCLGAGLAFNRHKFSSTAEKQAPAATGAHLLTRRLAVICVSVAFGQMLMALPLPRTNLNLFYVISFLVYTLFSYAIAAPIPKLAKQCLDLKVKTN